FVRGAEPGDVLAIDVEAIETAGYGFSAVFAGFSRLSERFATPALSHWHIEGDTATSPQIPGVTIGARPFLGIVGVAPSPSRMQTFRDREQRLADGGCMLMLPTTEYAIPRDPAIAPDAIRTMTPRENGGNWDVEAFGIGST